MSYTTYHEHLADRADVVDVNVDKHLKRSTFRNTQLHKINHQLSLAHLNTHPHDSVLSSLTKLIKQQWLLLTYILTSWYNSRYSALGALAIMRCADLRFTYTFYLLTYLQVHWSAICSHRFRQSSSSLYQMNTWNTKLAARVTVRKLNNLTTTIPIFTVNFNNDFSWKKTAKYLSEMWQNYRRRFM